MSTTAGLQFPVTPFCDVVGKLGTAAPEQIERLVPKPNVGVRFGLTVKVNVCIVAHWPGLGVKV